MSIQSSFYRSQFSHIALENCDGLVRIKGAGGDVIRYVGYLIVSVTLSGHKSVDIPVLFVDDTVWPLLVGDNLLDRLEEDPSNSEIHPSVVKAKRV